MLKKAILCAGTLISLFLLWFAFYNCSQAVPIAQQNLRGVALSLAAALENLAVHDPSLAQLARFRAPDLAYFALADQRGIYRCHSNADLIGKAVTDSDFLTDLRSLTASEARVRLGTGEEVFVLTTPLYLRDQTLLLRLALHTYRADAVIRRAKLNTTILLGLLAVGWLFGLALARYARREASHRTEMARRESLARLGEMGATLAHEIRNPLSGIKGFAQVIAKRPADPRNSGFAMSIVTEAVRLENLVNDLLAYAASDPPAPEVANLAAVVDDTLALVASDAAAQGVEIAREYPHTLPVSLSRDRLVQLLLNLCNNALQAMPEGGVLSCTALAAGDLVVLKVADTGGGIEEQDLERVFEPFFTTRARGTGLGLALCRKIAEQHQGKIELTSVVGLGTTATLTLPLAKDAAADGSMA